MSRHTKTTLTVLFALTTLCQIAQADVNGQPTQLNNPNIKGLFV